MGRGVTVEFDLTKEEMGAIKTLQRLGKRWPKSLWLYSASGSLHVMRKDTEGNRTTEDQGFIVATIEGIENDGGDF